MEALISCAPLKASAMLTVVVVAFMGYAAQAFKEDMGMGRIYLASVVTSLCFALQGSPAGGTVLGLLLVGGVAALVLAFCISVSGVGGPR